MAVGYQNGYVISVAEVYDDYVAPDPPGIGERYEDADAVRGIAEASAQIISEPTQGFVTARADISSVNILAGLDADTVSGLGHIATVERNERITNGLATGLADVSHSEYFVPISTFKVTGLAEISGESATDDIEAGTVFGVGHVLFEDYRYFEDSMTVPGGGFISQSLDSFHSADSDTAISESFISSIDFQHSEFMDFAVGVAEVSGDDVADFVDAGTAISEGVPCTEIFDAGSVTGVADISSIDGYSYSDTGLVVVVATPSAETSTKFDSDTLISAAVVSGIDSYGHSQSVISEGLAEISGVEFQTRERTGAGVSVMTNIDVTVTDYVDAGTVTSVVIPDAPNYGGYDFGSTYNGTVKYNDAVVAGEIFTDV